MTYAEFVAEARSLVSDAYCTLYCITESREPTRFTYSCNGIVPGALSVSASGDTPEQALEELKVNIEAKKAEAALALAKVDQEVVAAKKL